MKKLILGVVAALFAAFALVMLAPSPAQAVGWTAPRCDSRPGNGWKVCISVHTIKYGNGLRIDQIENCGYRTPLNWGGTPFQGTKSDYMEIRGGGGALLGNPGLWAIYNPSFSGGCSYTNNATNVQGGACTITRGSVVLSGWPDDSYVVRLGVTGGAC